MEGSQFLCSSVILIAFVFRTGKYSHPQVLLEEHKYAVKEKKMPEYITYELEISSDNSGRKDSNEKILMKKILMTKILMKKITYRIVEYHIDFKRFMKCSYNLHSSYTKINL